ncbi:putative protein ABIL2 isoform X1 [Typha angustifolia]|uniref:putative protein ABIL2 isoform X1 n=1 Tax=Typha angustifolia TaxID=59011 RepID=UPI003C302374
METLSPSSASFDELSMQQSLLFSDCLKDLKSLRSQLYSAAEYFELSYSNDDQKLTVMKTLKDYAVKAVVNTIDHLGSVTYKVNGLVDEKFDEISETEFRVSCIEQRLRTCREYVDREGFSQQSLLIRTPKYHKRYILPVGRSISESGKYAVPKNQGLDTPKDNNEFILMTAAKPKRKEKPISFRKLRSISRGHSQRMRSSSPPPKMRSPSPSSQHGKYMAGDRRAVSPIPFSGPLPRSGSLSKKPSLLKSSSVRHQKHLEPSASMQLHAERNEDKEIDQNTGKGRNFLKSLLSRRKSRKEEAFYNYLDEY